MDQLKKILAGMQKNSFWIVSGLTVLLGIIGYWTSRSTMDKLFKEQSDKINEAYSSLQTISNEVTTHPNAKTHQEMDKQIQSLVGDVETAWRKQYERQAAFMQWPKDLPPSLVAKVKDLRPIELKLEYPLSPASDPLVRGDLANYAKYVDTQFPALAKIIGTKWVGSKPAANAASGGYGASYNPSTAGSPDSSYGGGASYGGASYGGDPSMAGYGGATGAYGATGYGAGVPVNTDLVIWPKPVQDAVFADIQMWRGQVPTTHEVLYTQENIWILEGLLKIIAQVNAKANAVANFQATVKEIEFLRIGRSAVGRVGSIDRPGVAGMGAYGGSSSMMGMGMDSADMESSGMESSGMDSSAGMENSGGMSGMDSGGENSGEYGMVAATPDPANGRYVDAAYAPLTGDDLRTKMNSSSPEDAYFAVAKRVPVRMRLKVDQRRIQTLVAECGNADLMFEIRQVRIGDTTPAPAPGSNAGYGGSVYGGDSGMGGYGGVMGGESSGEGGYAMGMGGYGSGGMMAAAPSKVWDLPVELYGVVYLFNPVDTAKLGLNKVTAETEVADKVEVSADEAQAAEAPAAAEGQAPAAQPAGAQGQAPAGAEAGAQTPPANGQAPNGQQPAGQPPAGQPGQGQAAQGQGAQGQGAQGQGPQGAPAPNQAGGGQAPAGQNPAGQVPAGQGAGPNGAAAPAGAAAPGAGGGGGQPAAPGQ